MSASSSAPVDIDLPEVNLPDVTYPTREELEAEGYVIRIGGDEADYFSDPCKHISLNVSIGKILVTECEEDAMRQHPRLGGKRKKTTAAMQEGALFDRLLTGSLDYQQSDSPSVWQRAAKGGKKVDTVCYSDWNGLRVIDADAYTTAVVRECRDDAREKGLQPVLQEELVESVAEAKELLVRLELAGIDLQAGKHQVPVYWVEFADDGTPVQCRGMLDQFVEQVQRFLIRDLKKLESLRLDKVSRSVWDYGWDIQAAAYVSAIERVTGEYGRVEFEWALIRVGELPAARKVNLSGYRMDLSRRRWRVAVNRWAKCMKTKFWRGYEMDPQSLAADPWMDNQVSELEGVEDGE
jgi:PDDEXK-like domain of unknown function (DUF3799)